MKKIVALFGTVLFFGSMALAFDNDRFSLKDAVSRQLFGEIDGYIQMTTENDTLDNDKPVYRSEIGIYKIMPYKSIYLQPYYYFKDEAYNFPLNDKVTVENMLGLDLIMAQSPLSMFTLGAAYKYRYKSTGNNDGLIVTKARLDF